MTKQVRFTQEIFDAICARLSTGESLRDICKDKKMPGAGTVYRWLDKPQTPEIRDQYARARQAQADALFDQCLDIADQYAKSDEGESVDHVQRARLRIDTRKWMAGKLRPKKYGEKVVNEHSGPDGGAIPVGIDIAFRKS